MLVLTRKPSEQIVLEIGGETVFVRVVSIDGNKVRLGIEAPPSVAIQREEIYQRRNQWETGAPAGRAPALC